MASYSIDRRRMQNYVRDLVKDDTCALICIDCARRIPYVPRRQNMNINKIRLLERVDQGGAESTKSCGLSPLQTEHLLGVRTDVQMYWQMSEDVAFGEHHAEFADWQLQVPFVTATVNNLCCPEDVHSEGESQHDYSTCCTILCGSYAHRVSKQFK